MTCSLSLPMLFSLVALLIVSASAETGERCPGSFSHQMPDTTCVQLFPQAVSHSEAVSICAFSARPHNARLLSLNTTDHIDQQLFHYMRTSNNNNNNNTEVTKVGAWIGWGLEANKNDSQLLLRSNHSSIQMHGCPFIEDDTIRYTTVCSQRKPFLCQVDSIPSAGARLMDANNNRAVSCQVKVTECTSVQGEAAVETGMNFSCSSPTAHFYGWKIGRCREDFYMRTFYTCCDRSPLS